MFRNCPEHHFREINEKLNIYISSELFELQILSLSSIIFLRFIYILYIKKLHFYAVSWDVYILLQKLKIFIFFSEITGMLNIITDYCWSVNCTVYMISTLIIQLFIQSFDGWTYGTSYCGHEYVSLRCGGNVGYENWNTATKFIQNFWANSECPDQTAHMYEQPDLGLHCILFSQQFWLRRKLNCSKLRKYTCSCWEMVG